MDVIELNSDGMNRINLAQDRDLFRGLVNTVIKLDVL
jgi:hypothetical protein